MAVPRLTRAAAIRRRWHRISARLSIPRARLVLLGGPGALRIATLAAALCVASGGTVTEASTRSLAPAAALPGAAGAALPLFPPGSAAPAASPPAIPVFDHIYLIVMENHEFGSIVGSSDAPYINGLIRRYGLATRMTAVAHPSQPNYLALFAGSTFAVHDDGVHHLTAKNLVDQLQAHDRTWRVYAQNLPAQCSQVFGSKGPVDLAGLPGWYARKHEPAITFNDIAGSSTRCARITHLAGFNPAAADFELIVPNMSNDMHDGTIAQGDAFLRAFVPRITSSAAFAKSLLIITWDEGGSSIGGGGRVATIVVSPQVPRGFRSNVAHTHYSVLRTIEDSWGLGCLNQACKANNLAEFFNP